MSNRPKAKSICKKKKKKRLGVIGGNEILAIRLESIELQLTRFEVGVPIRPQAKPIRKTLWRGCKRGM